MPARQFGILQVSRLSRQENDHMESTYKPELWHDLFVMIGTSAGALVGLLFIVMSLHLGKISERTDYNTRATVDGARYNTIHLLAVLVEGRLF
jgi:hypothetical protein